MVSDIGTTITGAKLWSYVEQGAVTKLVPNTGRTSTVVDIQGTNLRGGGAGVDKVTLGGVEAAIAAGKGDVSPTGNCTAFDKITISGSNGNVSRLMLGDNLSLKAGCSIVLAGSGLVSNAAVNGSSKQIGDMMPNAGSATMTGTGTGGTVQIVDCMAAGDTTDLRKIATGLTKTIAFADRAGIDLDDTVYLPPGAATITILKDCKVTGNYVNNLGSKVYNGSGKKVTVEVTSDLAHNFSTLSGSADVELSLVKSGILTLSQAITIGASGGGARLYTVGANTKLSISAANSSGVALNGSGSNSSVQVTAMQAKLDYDGSELNNFPNGRVFIFAACGSNGNPVHFSGTLKPKAGKTFGSANMRVELEANAHVNFGRTAGTNAQKYSPLLEVTSKNNESAWTGALANGNEFWPTKEVEFSGTGHLYLLENAVGGVASISGHTSAVAGKHTVKFKQVNTYDLYEIRTSEQAPAVGTREAEQWQFTYSTGTLTLRVNGGSHAS